MSTLLVLFRDMHGVKDSYHHAQLSVWDTTHPNNGPTALLCGAPLPTCACFAPNNNFVVAAGSATGALALWDLRERGEPGTGMRDAAYTTSGVCGVTTSHQPTHSSKIIDLCPMTDPFASTRGNASFQLASVDDRGLVAIWLVVESMSVKGASLSQATAAVTKSRHGIVSHVDETLLGIRAGGTLRLTCSCYLTVWSSVPAFFALRDKTANKRDVGSATLGRMLLDDNCGSSGDFIEEIGVGPGLSAFAPSPANQNEFIVGFCAKKTYDFNALIVKLQVALSDGQIIKCSRLGFVGKPRVFFASSVIMRRSIAGELNDAHDAKSEISTRPLHATGACATCLTFSPFANDLFLVGQLDGGCRLHQLDRPTPLLSWPFFEPPKVDTTQSAAKRGLGPTPSVADLKWSPQRPNVFFLLHSNGDLHIFDFYRNDTVPVHSSAMIEQLDSRADKSPPRLAISNGLTPTNKVLAVAFGGVIFMRPLSESVSKQQDGELDSLRTKLAKAVAL